MRRKKIAATIYRQPPQPRQTCDILLPIGIYLNKEIQEADEGAWVEFRDDWRVDTLRLLHKHKVAVNSSEFTYLRRKLLPKYRTTQDLFNQWEAECVIHGYGKRAFSAEHVLYCEFEMPKQLLNKML